MAVESGARRPMHQRYPFGNKLMQGEDRTARRSPGQKIRAPSVDYLVLAIGGVKLKQLHEDGEIIVEPGPRR